MLRGHTYRSICVVAGVLLTISWAETASAISVTFASGDGTGCGAGPTSECVTVNPKTTIQPGHPSINPNDNALGHGSNTPNNVFVLDGSGPPTAFTRQNVSQWYHPETTNPINPIGASLNDFTGRTAHWVSYTDSGVDADPSQTNPGNFETPYPDHNPNPPAVPNYCGTTGTGGGIGGNVNPGGTPPCTGLDHKRMQNIPPPDGSRLKGNQTAVFTERVTLEAGLYDLELYAWADDTTIFELLGPNGTPVAMDTTNPFPANDGTAEHCANGVIACQQSAGGRFTASGLGGGTYTLNLYAYQVGSDVFGSLWGGVFQVEPPSQIPEPAAVLLLGSGLVGLGLLRRLRKAS